MTNTSYDNTTSILLKEYDTTTVSSSSKSLSPVAITFIVLGVILGVIFLIWAACHFYRRRHSKTPSPQPRPQPPQPSLPRPQPPQPSLPRLQPVKPSLPRSQPVKPSLPRSQPVKPSLPRSQPVKPSPSTPLQNLICRKPLCEEYLRGLNLPRAYFNTRFDSCFCRKCHDSQKAKSKCGEICIPFHTWTRFGVILDEVFAKEKKIFSSGDWKTSFYGTSSTKLKSILNDRSIPLDGDQLGGGETFRSEHPNPNVWTTFQSLASASDRQYAKLSNFRASDGNNYKVQVIFQCKQKMDTVRIDGEKWTTLARSSIVPYGLLVRLQKTS